MKFSYSLQLIIMNIMNKLLKKKKPCQGFYHSDLTRMECNQNVLGLLESHCWSAFVFLLIVAFLYFLPPQQ